MTSFFELDINWSSIARVTLRYDLRTAISADHDHGLVLQHREVWLEARGTDNQIPLWRLVDRGAMSPLNPLNPAAGEVPLPEDQREVNAALAAGRISHRVFPYVDWRYSERGRRFTHSDSAWLAWLTRHDQQRMNEQISWLRSVLSNRGMPSWILQNHLVILTRKLTETVPEKADCYQRLANSSEWLRVAAEEKINEAQTQRLIASFIDRVAPQRSSLLAGTGRLIVSSVSDEGLGVKNAVSSFVQWLLDLPRWRQQKALRRRLSHADLAILKSKSFENRWSDAVKTTIEDARKLVG